MLHYAFSSWIEKTMTKTMDRKKTDNNNNNKKTENWENRFVLQ